MLHLWLISYFSPAIVTEPFQVRPGLGSTDTVTLPLPVPLVGDRLTHDIFSDVVQLQIESEAVTVTVLLPPSGPKLPLDGEIAYVQDDSLWLMV
jgi:hypothetical protein